MYGKRSGGLYRSRPPGPAPNGAAPSPDAPRGGRPQNGAQNGDHPAPQQNGADAAKNGGPPAKNGELYVTTSTAETASATSRDNIRVETGSASSAVNRVKAQEAPGAAEGSTARPDVPGGTMKNSLIISRPGSGCGKNMLEEDVIGGPVQTSPKNFSTKGDFGSSLGGAAPFTEARDPCGTCRVGRLRFCGFFCSEKSALPPHSQS